MSEKFTLILDSTQITQFLSCPEEWNLAHNENLESNAVNRKFIDGGSYGHKMLEVYYKGKLSGLTRDQAIENAYEIKVPEYLQVDPEDIPIIKEKFLLYVAKFEFNDFQPSGSESVEVGFSFKVFENESSLYILEGKIDAHSNGIIRGSYNGMPAFMDHKFQYRARALYPKRIQFRNYALATDSRMAIINYIRLTKKTDQTTFERKLIPFSKVELDLWHKRLIQIYQSVEISMRMAAGGAPYEHRWNSCEGKFGYPCQFTEICECTDQLTLNAVKATKYHQIPVWKPWD